MYQINLSYDKGFSELLSDLGIKYKKEIFEIEGIGTQLDIAKFSKKYFSSVQDSSIDGNANVAQNTIITYKKEASKPLYKLNSLYILWKLLRKDYGTVIANEIIEKQINGALYIHDLWLIQTFYCFNYSCIDIVNKGLPMISSIKSVAPKYLYSFKSQLEQFIIIATNSSLGASSTADLLLCMSYYFENIKKRGNDAGIYFDGWMSDEDKTKTEPFLDRIDKIHELMKSNTINNEEYKNSELLVEIENIENEIYNTINRTSPSNEKWFRRNYLRYLKETLISLVYTLNQPMRGDQSAFTNISIYDKHFIEDSKDMYIFPDLTQPNIENVNILQDMFLTIMNEELSRTVFTFPVTTACFSINEKHEIQDTDFANFIAYHNRKFGFINIFIGESSVHSSCCRLKSDGKNEYLNTIGGSSTKIGSLGCVTINMPRIAYESENVEDFYNRLNHEIRNTGRINNARRKMIQRKIDEGYMPLYTHGFVDIGKQYSTTGINGMYEAMLELGYDISNDIGLEFAEKLSSFISEHVDALQKIDNKPHNCEIVPGETCSVKNAEKDKLLGLNKHHKIYSNQFYPIVSDIDLLDRIKIQAKLDNKFSGGNIMHVNIENETSVTNMVELIKLCAVKGIRYFGINYNIQLCENGHITTGKNKTCKICGTKITDNFTRIVGFLVNTKLFNKTRQEIDYPNRIFYKGE